MKTRMDQKRLYDPSFPQKRESSLIEQAWIKVSQQRLDEILSHKVKTIPSEKVFEHIDQLLG